MQVKGPSFPRCEAAIEKNVRGVGSLASIGKFGQFVDREALVAVAADAAVDGPNLLASAVDRSVTEAKSAHPARDLSSGEPSAWSMLEEPAELDGSGPALLALYDLQEL